MTYPEPNTDGTNIISIYGWGREHRAVLQQQGHHQTTRPIGGRSVAFFMWSVVTDSSGDYQCVDDQGDPEFQMTNGNKVNTSQWSRILNGMKAGDFLLIQFGTNDETHTCPRYVSLPDFETDFGLMADAARAKGATPIFVTPMGHRYVQRHDRDQHAPALRQRDEERSDSEDGRGRGPEPRERGLLHERGEQLPGDEHLRRRDHPLHRGGRRGDGDAHRRRGAQEQRSARPATSNGYSLAA